MRIAIISDAGEPQVNGVVNTLRCTVRCLRDAGHEVLLLTPRDFRTFACPTYPEIRLAYQPYARIAQALQQFMPDCIHIATEGPMGLAARRYCLRHRLDFTSAYHTRFPEYLAARRLLPKVITYALLRWFHKRSQAVMVPTPAMKQALQQQGFGHVALWGRGVDTTHFRPVPEDHACIERPLLLYVGRVAVEKNIEAFLRLDLPGTKWVVGDGPQCEELARRYPQVRFLGAKGHDELPAYYNCADVFVFPSKTDTFGLVLLEAMACGIPVAAYPVEGPIDVVEHGVSGILDADLKRACLQAIGLDPVAVRAHAEQRSWESATQQFLHHLHLVRRPAAARAPVKAIRGNR
ncbi:glycosyltransferase family 1 protein [Herbaspirillum sp. YR522]|uniref:glycosyltransferase family 4 protein n=1 Tax=Herbaspirillum sp. YR522 TaxID=1144342 RepID=UPI00026FCCD9|nr:glycosyltransferase family 1 protein [Herbaspirillum sp. YR522]EJN10276.1 glycosyltransferase [Herbaspirillum sp. YR522]